jgi:hypothetical protein
MPPGRTQKDENTDSRFEGVQEDVNRRISIDSSRFPEAVFRLSQNEISDKLGQLRNTETLKPWEVSP